MGGRCRGEGCAVGGGVEGANEILEDGGRVVDWIGPLVGGGFGEESEEALAELGSNI